MTTNIEQQLKQDGLKIKQQVESRLADWDVGQAVLEGIKQQAPQATKPRALWYGVAAAMVMAFMLWSFHGGDISTEFEAISPQQIAAENISQNLKQLPLTLEQKVNQPLVDEQQAILKDLQTLRSQLLSI